MGKGKKIGYARISSKTQNVDRQIKELNEYGCDKIFIDIASGRDFKRTEYQKMKNILRFDDELVIHDLSRFGRNKEEILQEWKEIMELEADITVLNMPILNTAQYKESKAIGQLVSDIFLTVLSWTVEEERKRIKEAQKEGIAIAKEKGKFKGRPTKYHANAKDPKDRLIYNEIIRLLNENESVKNISEKTGVTRMTIYNIKKKYVIV
ncbi:recombinase family protein [Peribacillus frigoritolerans]|uniref:recombinase family protein n=1 Tax=Peribacillus frigoritolerans TaxID=450367 RepID=UPI0039A38875